MSYYYLEIIKGPAPLQVYALAEGATSLGRSFQNSVCLPPSASGVSGHHAIVYRTADRLLLQDLESTNGTYINGKRIKEGTLADGDEIGLGKRGPRFRLVRSETERGAGDASSSQQVTDAALFFTRTSEDEQIRRPRPTGPQTTRDSSNLPDEAFTNEPPPVAAASASLTQEMEQRIARGHITENEMRGLMQNGRRMEKILTGGGLPQPQTDLLRTTYTASRRLRRTRTLASGIVAGLAVLAALFFGIRAFQYRALLRSGQGLEQTLDRLEERVMQARNAPEVDSARLRALVIRLEKTTRSLAAVRGRLRRSDRQRLFDDPLEQKIHQVFLEFGESEYHIPPEMVARVRHHIDIYTGRMRPVITTYLARREVYFPMIQEVFVRKRVPPILAYVAMLESGLDTLALSHAGARGLWQFMPHTARRYGLRVDATRDERTSAPRATVAAAEYFKDLLGIFGGRSSVMLAMAAYNAGEGRVMQALRKIDNPLRDRDFWYIYRMGYLAEETNEYIPRVVALIIIATHANEYGMTLPAPTPRAPA